MFSRVCKKDGKAYWYFQFYDYLGKRRTVKGYTSKTETEKLERETKALERLKRRGMVAIPKATDKPHAFDDIRDEYLLWGKSCGGIGGKPWSEEHAKKRGQILKFWQAKLNLDAMTDLIGCKSAVEKILRDLQDAKKSDLHRRNILNGLIAFCSWCLDHDYLAANPLRSVTRPPKTTKRTQRRAMTPDEVSQLLTHCAQYRRPMYEVALASGLRANELRSLKVKDLLADKCGLNLDASWTKNRKPGFQPLPATLVAKLAASVKGKQPFDALLWVPMHTGRDLKLDLVRAGVTEFAPGGRLDFHALRVTYITAVIEAGANVKEAQTLARHSDPSLTMNIYARTRPEKLADVATKVGAAMLPNLSDSIPVAYKKAAGAENTVIPTTSEKVAGVHGNRTHQSLLRRTQRL